jgi:hypothetical protein
MRNGNRNTIQANKTVVVFHLLAALLVLGCQGPQVFVLHAPIQPSNAQPVTYTSSAEDPDGVRTIEIWEDRQELKPCTNGMPCAMRVSVTKLKTCTFDPPDKHGSCAVTTPSGYPDNSLIGYRAIATDARGNRDADGWVYYAAGAFPWPDLPIPVYITGPPSQRLDVTLIPDAGYAGQEEFMTDATQLIHDAYLSTAPAAQEIRAWRGFWNFYVTYRPAKVQGFEKGCYRPPANWPALRGVSNAGAVLHRQNIRDCIGTGEGSLFSLRVGEPSSNAMAIHQTAHTLLGLADEYCCDGGYWENVPTSNVFSSRARCRAYASSHGWPDTQCRQIGNPTFWRAAGMTGWWRIDQDGDAMELTGNLDRAFGPADQTRIRWIYLGQCNTETGC